MNIFVSDQNYVKSATALDDKRLVKMVLETTQMLSTAINECGGKAPYKSTHKNHPCNVWARQTTGNFEWLLNHGFSLSIEYTGRFGKIHKCANILYDIQEQRLNKVIPSGPLTPFANCAANSDKGISYKHISDTIQAYKLYLIDRWNTDKRKPVWTNNSCPYWVDFDIRTGLFNLAPEKIGVINV